MENYKKDINKLFDFWRFLRISENSVIEQAETGDIVLGLQCKKSMGKVSNIKIIHVCLIIRIDEQSIEKKEDMSQIYVVRSGEHFH